MNEKILKSRFLFELLDLEIYFLLGAWAIVAWIFYKFFLSGASEDRHKIIRNHFRVLGRHFATLSFLFLGYMLFQSGDGRFASLRPITGYLAVLSFVWGNVVFVKTSRLIVLQYMFLSSMKHGVPLLIVNIFSLILSLVITVWGLSNIFGLEVAPLLATSAAASVILGLALQDTLGNLFAGISLQLDRNFEIGDWLEVQMNGQKIVGKVEEITWRSTTLVGWSEELITLPNKALAQAQISNFTIDDQPIVRRQVFKIALGEDSELGKRVIEHAIAGISDVRGIPSPFVYISDTNENWVELKVVYFIDHYPSQFVIGDKVYAKGLKALMENKIKLARQVIELSDNSSPYGRLTEPPSHSN